MTHTTLGMPSPRRVATTAFRISKNTFRLVLRLPGRADCLPIVAPHGKLSSSEVTGWTRRENKVEELGITMGGRMDPLSTRSFAKTRCVGCRSSVSATMPILL